MGEQENQLNEIYQQLEGGDISVTEAIQKSNALTAQIATKEAIDGANQKTREVFANRDVEAARAVSGVLPAAWSCV